MCLHHWTEGQSAISLVSFSSMGTDGLTQLCTIFHQGRFLTGQKFEMAYKSKKIISKSIFFCFQGSHVKIVSLGSVGEHLCVCWLAENFASDRDRSYIKNKILQAGL